MLPPVASVLAVRRGLNGIFGLRALISIAAGFRNQWLLDILPRYESVR